jgi:hypothetical protein
MKVIPETASGLILLTKTVIYLLQFICTRDSRDVLYLRVVCSHESLDPLYFVPTKTLKLVSNDYVYKYMLKQAAYLMKVIPETASCALNLMSTFYSSQPPSVLLRMNES